MSTSRLKLYNDALTICKESHLASLTEDRKPRRLLDHVWDNDGVKNCLEAADWKFALRSVRLDYDPAYSPEFGYQYQFEKASDWCKTSAVCSDERFEVPLLKYDDEAGFLYCDLQELYCKYVSNDSTYGGDMSLWTSRFADFVAAHFASKIIHALTSDDDAQKKVFAIRQKYLLEASSLDAMAGPTKFPPEGSWVSSRRSRGRSWRSRGTDNIPT